MKKISKIQEAAFQSHIANEKISASRWLCILGVVMYAFFAVADLYSLSVTLVDVLLVRGSVVATILVSIVFIFAATKLFIKYYDPLVAGMFLITAGGIEAMIYLAVPGDHAFNVYFAGILLVIMSVFAWAYLKLITSIAVTLIIISAYVYIGITKGLAVSSLLVNILFIIGAGVIGLLSQIVRDRYIRENFFLQQSLKESLNEKTIEAKDNAYLANHDALTSLPNRRYITELLEKSLQIAKEKDKILAILFFDLNGFKQVNDIYGHAVGDEVLVIVAKRLELAIRKGDHISRLSGDEFLVSLMMDRNNASEIKKMAAKFTAIVSEPMHIDDNIVKVGASIGVAAYPIHGNKVSTLIDIADQKMYQKKQGLQKLAKERAKNSEPEPVVIFPGNSKSRH